MLCNEKDESWVINDNKIMVEFRGKNLINWVSEEFFFILRFLVTGSKLLLDVAYIIKNRKGKKICKRNTEFNKYEQNENKVKF